MNNLKTIKIKIWSELLVDLYPDQFINISGFYIKKLVPNLKLPTDLLENCTQDIWKVFKTDLTWTSYEFPLKN